MTKNQLKVLNELMKDQQFKGKRLLKRIIWLNTVEPKYQIGECYKVTDTSRTILGERVVNFKAKIVEIKTMAYDEEYYYTLETTVIKGDKNYTTTLFATEHDLGMKAKDSINKFGGELDVVYLETTSL